MPPHPQVADLLALINARGGPPVTEQSPEEFRAGFRAGSGARGRPADPAPTEDRVVPGPAGDIPVRIYRPAAPGPLPLVVYFHGGGWVIGDLDTHDGLCQYLAVGTPAVVVSVDYPLSPEHPFPAALEAAEAAARWAADHARELGADPARLAVAGDSAGGNLATVVARRARDASGPDVAFQLLVYPVCDLTRSMPSYTENGTGYMLTGEMMELFIDHYLAGGDPRDPDASPLFADDLAGLPPGLVLTAELDPLRDEGEAYAARLRDAGVAVEVRRYDGMIHGFVGFDLLIDDARTAIDDLTAALRAGLAPDGD